MVLNVFKNNFLLYKELKKFKPDLLLSCASDVAQVGFLLRIPSFVINDDDYSVVPFSALFGWPFATKIFVPSACKMGYWSKKTIFYFGYQKLAYLNSKYFQPEKRIVKKHGLSDNYDYFLIRSVSLTAHHDKNIRGLNYELVEQMIKIMSQCGKVYISSEKELPKHLQPYELKINPLDIHHLIYFSALLVGDSQSMAHEAALLGTPSIRYNDFVGKIGVLEELGHKYGLSFGISPDNPELLIEKVKKLSALKNKRIFQDKAKKMVESMIDLPSFLVWFVDNYPQSEAIIKNNSGFQYRFK